MAERHGTNEFRVTLSLRVKVILTFLLINLVASGFLAVSLYTILNRNLFRDMQSRVGSLTRIGARLLDAEALSRLGVELSPDLSPGRVDAVEGSADFRAVSDALNAVRAVESTLVHYIYVFRPTADPNTALYLVDADVLEDRAKRAAGEETKGDISHFGSSFDLSEFPVARRVVAERIPMVEPNFTYDAEFKVNSLTGYAPLMSRDGSIVGVLGIDMVDTDVRAALRNATLLTSVVIGATLLLAIVTSILMGSFFTQGIISLDRVVRRFGKENLDVRAEVRSRDEVGRLGASFNAMAETIQEYSARLEALLSAYGRFVPHELLRLLDKGSILDVKLGDQAEKEMTVLFSDIRSFTSLSETMTPFENFNFINSYLRRMGPEIRANRGFIDKYIGDAIMALFPERPDDALAAALAMQGRLREYNVHRAKSGYRQISIGTGVHTGSLMLGTVGEHERMDGSVIADAVNLCSRLQALTRVYGAQVLTTGRTLKGLANPGQFPCRFIDRIRVRGKKQTVLLFEVIDGEGSEQERRKLSYRKELSRALRLYFARDFSKALGEVKSLRESNPEDEVLRIYQKRCELLVTLGTPAEWEGVEDIDLG